jgi:hypothetical protein
MTETLSVKGRRTAREEIADPAARAGHAAVAVAAGAGRHREDDLAGLAAIAGR